MDKRYIGLIGKNRGGKGVVCNLIAELAVPKTTYITGFSDPINESLFALALEKSRLNQDRFSTGNREIFGQDLLAKAMYGRALRAEVDIVALHGIRRPADTVKLRELPGFRLVYIDAPARLRYEWMKRANEREGDKDKTWEQFLVEERAEPQLLIDEIAKQADIVLVNDEDDPTYAKLRRQVADLLEVSA